MSPAQLDQIAQSIGLNMPAYNQCRADKDGKEREEIEADMRYGQKIGVRGTPTIYINGVLYQQERSYDGMKAAIDKLLNSYESYSLRQRHFDGRTDRRLRVQSLYFA